MKLLNRFLLIGILAANLYATDPGDETVQLNFVNTPISHLTTLISDLTGNNFVSSNDIPGNFTFVSQKPIKRKNLMSVYEMILRTKGYMIVNHEDKGFFMITRNNNPQRENIKFNIKKNNYEITTEVINLKYFKPSKIKNIVAPYFTSAGKVVADDQLNFLMITDYYDSIQKIKKIIAKVDQPNNLKLHWVKLENVNIKNVFPQIKTLAKIVSEQFRKTIQVIDDKSSNSVIISCEGNEYIELAKLIKKVDDESKLNMNASVIYLKNSKAADLVKIIQDMEKTRYEKGDIKDRERISISHDVSLNSIILMGEKSVINNYKKIISDLDKPKQQVYVEAQIIEINMDKVKELGIKWDSLFGGHLGENGGWAAKVNLNSDGSSPAIANYVSALGTAGNAYKIGGMTVGATLSLLDSKGASKTLSSPKLLCLDNQESSIYVGKVAPFQTADAVNTATTTQGATYTYKDVGLTLKIKPQIMADGKVRLDVTNKLEDIISGSTTNLPTTTKREIKSTSIVNDGGEVVIAGLIRDKKDQTKYKVPLLGDIPFLGELFRHTSTNVERVNLVVILRPTVVKDVKDLQGTSNQIQGRLISKKDKATLTDLQKIEKVKEKKEEVQKKEIKEKLEKEIEKKQKEDKPKEQSIFEQHKDIFGIQ